MVALGKSPIAEQKAKRAAYSDALTVKEFSKRYLAEVVAKERKSIAPIERLLENQIIPAHRSRAGSRRYYQSN